MLHIAACHDCVEIVKTSLEEIPVDLQDQVMLLLTHTVQLMLL